MLVLINGAFKYVINLRKGILGERMLRRMRYDLFSQLMRFRASPGEIIDVRRGDQGGRAAPVTVHVVAGEYFDARVEGVAAPMSDNAAARGALGGAQMATRNQFRRARGRM